MKVFIFKEVFLLILSIFPSQLLDPVVQQPSSKLCDESLKLRGIMCFMLNLFAAELNHEYRTAKHVHPRYSRVCLAMEALAWRKRKLMVLTS